MALVLENGADGAANLIVVIDDEDLGLSRNGRDFDGRRGGAGGFARSFSIACVSSRNFTGLLNCTQSCSAISRSASVEMSPVRMMNGILRSSSPPQSLRNFDAGQAVRQIVVGEDEIGALLRVGQQGQGGGTVDRGQGVVALLLQEEFEVFADLGIVLDDQNRRRTRRRPDRGRRRAARSGIGEAASPPDAMGTSIENTEPLPGSERTRI